MPKVSKVKELRHLEPNSKFFLHNRGTFSSKFFTYVGFYFNMCYCESDKGDVKYISPNTLVHPLNNGI
jgi:hypothetical protein